MAAEPTASSAAIIGGMFGLDLEGRTGSLPPLLRVPGLWLANARGALRLLHDTLHPTAVWLPSYLCDVVARAFPLPQVRWYDVGGELRPVDAAWVDEVQSGDLVLFIDYFGFARWEENARAVRRRGAWVVEDACQSMLNEACSPCAQFVICSPRKFFGVPDGGILAAMGDAPLPVAELPRVEGEWWLEAFDAIQRRTAFDQHGGDRRWFDLFRRIEAGAPFAPHRMSALSEIVLRQRTDYAATAARRRANYERLARTLADVALFPERLADGVVPIGFPVRLENREDVRRALFARDIFPPVHWDLHDVVPAGFEASHRLAGQVMTLPCDQRYDEADMARVAEAFVAAGPLPARE